LGVLLSDAGHDAVHVGDLALLGATDETVMAAALDDSRIVVSADTDFGEVLAASIAQYPSVILLRRKGPHVRPPAARRAAEVIELLSLRAPGARPCSILLCPILFRFSVALKRGGR